MDPNLEPLRDIRGLDPLSWWPIAPGWWWILGVVCLTLVLSVAFAWWWRHVRRDWRAEARVRLRVMRARAHQTGAKVFAAELGELLRRVAMVRHGRAACASLTGDAWLAWLEEHDPDGFPWQEKGRIFVELPYAPPQAQAGAGQPAQFKALVDAVLPWVDAELPRPAQRPRRLLRIRVTHNVQAQTAHV